MFHINILTIGKNKEQWLDASITHYLTLLKKYATVEMIYVPDAKNAKNMNAMELKKVEAVIFNKYGKSDYRIALSDRGKIFESIQFSSFLMQLMQKINKVEFLIGGIYGLDDSILKDSKQILSLSPMTFSHQLVRPILLEQLYRGLSIISGSSYHK
jgi:23S rRNA (pseudouridine1915-N3)-methyltransferase